MTTLTLFIFRLLVEFTRGMPRGRFSGGGGGGRGDGGGDYRGRGRGGRDDDYRSHSQRSSYNQRSPRGGGGGGGGGGNGVAARTPHRAVVENLSSSVSWQVNNFLLL